MMDLDYFDRINNILDEEKWIEEFLLGQGICVICGHDDPLDLEGHHPGRERNHPWFIISVCRNCHGRFTRKQRWWSEKSLDRKNPPKLRMAFVYRGLSEAFKEKARRIFAEYGMDIPE